MNCNNQKNCLNEHTDQYVKNTYNNQYNNQSQKEKNKTYIVSTLETICIFGIIIALIATVVFLLFQLENGSEIISLIDDMVFGVGISFLFLLATAISDLFT